MRLVIVGMLHTMLTIRNFEEPVIKFIASVVAALSVVAVFHVGSTFAGGDADDHIVVAAADFEMSEGEIRKVDPETKKITIKHGELKNLDMPAMTMVFQVKDPAVLEQVNPGD